MSRTVEICSKLYPGGRRPKHVIVKNGEVFLFTGGDRAGVVQVVDSRSGPPNGKWTASLYTVLVGDNTAVVEVLAPLHGRFWHDASADAAFERFSAIVREKTPNAKPLGRASWEAFMKEVYPDTWSRWNPPVDANLD